MPKAGTLAMFAVAVGVFYCLGTVLAPLAGAIRSEVDHHRDNSGPHGGYAAAAARQDLASLLDADAATHATLLNHWGTSGDWGGNNPCWAAVRLAPGDVPRVTDLLHEGPHHNSSRQTWKACSVSDVASLACDEIPWWRPQDLKDAKGLRLNLDGGGGFAVVFSPSTGVLYYHR